MTGRLLSSSERKLAHIGAVAIASRLPVAFDVSVHDFYHGYPLCPFVPVLILGHQLEGETTILWQREVVDSIGHEDVVLIEVV